MQTNQISRRLACILGAVFLLVSSVAFAEVKTYTGVGKCTMGDLVTPTQAKNYAQEKAMINAKEQAGVYLTGYIRTNNTHLAANEIKAITNNITEVVGAVNYTQESGEIHGQPVVVYTATLTAKVDTEGIKQYLSRDENERVTIVQQSNESAQNIKETLTQIEKLNEAYGKAGSEQEKEKIRREFADADRRLLAEQKNNEGVELYYKKDYNNAIKFFRECIDLNPNLAESWNNLGTVYDSLGNYDKAIECYRKAIDLNPKYSLAWNNIGYACYKSGNRDKCIEYFHKALELDPKNPFAWNNIGYLYDKLGDYNKAIEYYSKAVEFNPKKAIYWNNMGESYLDLNNYDKAMECICKALELDPKYEVAWNDLGYLYYKLGNRDKAIECFRKALELKPDYKSAQNNLKFLLSK